MVKDFVTLIFSKDRPLQLDLTLTTMELNAVADIRPITVLFKASNERYLRAYEQVEEEHQFVTFIKEESFRNDLLDLLYRRKYVFFIVDDTIFTSEYNTEEISGCLQMFRGCLGFSLRLGQNTKICYPTGKENKIPEFQPALDNIKAYNWTGEGEGDFYYPLELSSSVYRVEDLVPILINESYMNPNSLEWAMSQKIKTFLATPYMLCYEKSVAFSNPINRVQQTNTNRAGKNPKYSPEVLLQDYLEGLRIDPAPFRGYVSNGCHEEVDITFLGE